jgi:hypothetical protein
VPASVDRASVGGAIVRPLASATQTELETVDPSVGKLPVLLKRKLGRSIRKTIESNDSKANDGRIKVGDVDRAAPRSDHAVRQARNLESIGEPIPPTQKNGAKEPIDETKLELKKDLPIPKAVSSSSDRADSGEDEAIEYAPPAVELDVEHSAPKPKR